MLLEVKDKNSLVKPTLKLGGKDGLSFTLSDDVPFIGGSDISVNLPAIPVNVVVEDGKVKVGINIKEKELYSANSYEGVTTTTKKKTMQQKIKDWKKTLYKTGNINKDWEGYLEKSNLKADMPLMDKGVKFTVFGYAEAEWSDSLESISGEIVVAISGSATFQKQSIIMYIPVTVNCTVTGSGEVDSEIKYDFINQEWAGNVKFDGSVAVEPYAGAGVGTWLSVGVYGQAKLGIRITLLTFLPPTKERGVDDIYLSGETGIKGYFAKKEVAKVPLLSLKNLKKTGLGQYINDNNELLIYSKEENSLINRKSARGMRLDFSNAEYIWNESNESLFRSAPMGDLRTETLVDSAYGAAEPQLITVNGTTLIAYLDNDESRALPNQTVVKYALYHSELGEFSEPKIALDDNTADYKPQLFTDGTDIYLYYLDSTRNYGSGEDPDIHEYAGTFAVTVAKYNADSDAFIKLGTVSRTGHYCYAPTLERREEGLFLVWAENGSDDVFGLTADNSINYAVFSDGAWSNPICIAENLNSVTSIASGRLGADETIAYSIDIDNDLTTAGQKICFLDESGTKTELMEDAISNLQYINLPELGQSVLAFNHNGAVEYIKAASDSPVKLLEEETMDSGSRFMVLDDRIYYLKTTDGNSRNLYCASYADGQWGSVALTDESAYVDAFSAADDKLVYLLTDADFGEDESGNGEVMTSSKIKFLASTETHDLKMENVDFDALNIDAGESLNLELSITNNGTEVVENPVVSFYLKSTPDSSQNITLSGSIHPGEMVQKTVAVTAPIDFSDAVYAVKIEEKGYDDCRETDNVEEVDLSKTELEIETEYKIMEDEKLLAVYVSNDSNVSSEAYVSVTDFDGNIIYTEENVSVPANECVNISVPLKELPLGENGETVLKATVSTDTEEYYLCNNTYEQRIWSVNTWKPVVSDISDEKDDSGNEQSGGIKNPFGDDLSGTKVQKPSVSKVKSFKVKAGKKKLTLSWKKLSEVAGYQIQISTKKNFKGAKVISISGSKKKYIKKGLKAKKKYYIRIRAYKTYRDTNGVIQRADGKWVKVSKKTK
ncbi:MAG: fibronectin type III domain-containing protein [Lachnospiraceae bacterium]|nr:fibronectin type III domain-containing protein [Lachnospiraceae bacterium]